MTTLHEQPVSSPMRINPESRRERRRHRRHDMEQQGIAVDRWDGARRTSQPFGTIVDLSAAGIRIRTREATVRADNQIRVRIELPAYAGICPFVDISAGDPQPKREWVGWMAVSRVQKIARNEYDVAGSLVDMEDLDRGMLGLYLSTQPMAA